jgi:hypothetical protein
MGLFSCGSFTDTGQLGEILGQVVGGGVATACEGAGGP